MVLYYDKNTYGSVLYMYFMDKREGIPVRQNISSHVKLRLGLDMARFPFYF